MKQFKDLSMNEMQDIDGGIAPLVILGITITAGKVAAAGGALLGGFAVGYGLSRIFGK